MDGKTVGMRLCSSEELPDELRNKSENTKRMIRKDGKIYLSLGRQVISCNDDPDGRELAFIVMLSCRGSASGTAGREELYFRILNDPGCNPDPDQLRKNRIDPSGERRVVVFRAFSPLEEDLAAVFMGIAPLESGDTVIPVDYRTVAFIREPESRAKDDELKEYIEAVIGTMEGEGITGVRAGIGNEAHEPESLRRSFREANDAIATGMKFHSRAHVYLYAGQTLDRILDSIPEDTRREIGARLSRNGNAGVLNDEMLETVRVFFQNDLNLTAASRQLFIHRNTLNYRLDKIRKETGLDLRSFEDAVIFRIIYGFLPGRS